MSFVPFKTKPGAVVITALASDVAIVISALFSPPN
jgi:hypothetical protein